MKPERKGVTKFEFSKVWEGILRHQFSRILVGQVFRDSQVSLVCGGEDGVIYLYPAIFTEQKQLSGFEKDAQRLETKGGPIQSLCLANVTNFNSIDLLAGDSRGMLTVFTNSQILNRRKLSEESISSVLVNKDPAGNSSVLISCLDGSIVAVSPHSNLWKCKIGDFLHTDHEYLEGQVEIHYMESVRITSMSSDCVYTVVADNRRHVHFFQQDSLVFSLPVPANVTCMCTGHFLTFEGIPLTDSKAKGLLSPVRPRVSRQEQQLALGLKNGEILVVSNFLLYQYANVDHELSCIRKLVSPKSGESTDSIICSGHFNAILVYKDTALREKVPTEDWVHTFDVINPLDVTRNRYVIAGCLDNKAIIFAVHE